MTIKSCLKTYLRNCTSCDWLLLHMCKMVCPANCFIFQKSDFSGFSKFINKCQKEILRCAPPSSDGCDFFVKLWLSLSQVELLRAELPKCTPNCTTLENCDDTICPVLSILFYMTQPIWLSLSLSLEVYLWARSFL